MFCVFRLFGRLPFQIILYPVILYFFVFQHKTRRASVEYLNQLRQTGALQSRAPLLWLSYKHFLQFGNGLLDKLAVWQDNIGFSDVDLQYTPRINQCLDQNQGAVLIGSHLGNLEICRALSEQQSNLRLNVLIHTKHAAKFNRLLNKVDANSRVNLIQVTEVTPSTAILLNDKIENGELIIIAGDRTPVTSGQRASKALFFDRLAPFPQGPFILASILKCPVFTLFCIKQKQRHTIFIDLLTEQIKLPRRERQSALKPYIQSYADQLAYYCKKAPLQWYNFYPFWDANPQHVNRTQSKKNLFQPKNKTRGI